MNATSTNVDSAAAMYNALRYMFIAFGWLIIAHQQIYSSFPGGISVLTLDLAGHFFYLAIFINQKNKK
jgi:hypothetical protein